MAMTEVLIAFLLLTIIFGIMYNCIRFASNMIRHATDTDREIAEYEQAVAQKFQRSTSVTDPYSLSSASGVTITFTDEASGSNYDLNICVGAEEVSYHEAGNPSIVPLKTEEIHVYATNAP